MEEADLEAIEADDAKEHKLSKKQKLKKQKKEDDKKLKEWDKMDEDQCYDIDSKIKYNPGDYEAEYLKGRPRCKDELEDQMGSDLKPFETLDIFTGQAGGLKLFGGDRRQVGKVKGLWELNTSKENPFGAGLKALVQTRTVAVRLYILTGHQLFPMDRDG